MSAINATTIRTVDDIHITLPDKAGYMSTFVLYEQQDWFEDEIKFLRRYIRSGMNILDIGANYGVYTLTMAKHISPTGRLWAFEPTSTTAAFLKNSIQHNKFDNVTLIQAALSNKMGSAELFVNQNSELNSLSQNASQGGQSETVQLLTLDHCREAYQFPKIDFIKLDAEGEENKILQAATELLQTDSPLIMYELKHGQHVNTSLINSFSDMHYDSYRLLPGLDCLVPFDPAMPFDGFLLNLFGCKEDKISQLQDEGFAVNTITHALLDDSSYARQYIATLAYYKSLNTDAEGDERFMKILSSYLYAMNSDEDISKRCALLLGAIDAIHEDIQRPVSVPKLCSYARICIDGGDRTTAVRLLGDIIKHYQSNPEFDTNGLLLPAHRRYDSITPYNSLREWLLSSALELYVMKHAFSCYFSGKQMLPVLQHMSSLGYMSADMQRREQLLRNVYAA